MTDGELPDDLRAATQRQWWRFIDETAALRPQLHAYCRRLTGNLWDAEDLVQDTMLRGFGTLGLSHQEVRDPRAYLVRIATNLWTDRIRRRAREAELLAVVAAGDADDAHTPADRGEMRDAAEVLLGGLSPQERAAVTMKDVLDFSLDEIASVLGTTANAVKSALHRGRGRIAEARDAAPVPRARDAELASMVDRFIDRLDAADLDGLLALVLPTGSVHYHGALVETGREQFQRKGSWFWQAVNVHPELPPDKRPPKFLNARAEYEGEPIMLSYVMHDGSKLVTGVTRLTLDGGLISRVDSYGFTPETVHEVAESLGLQAARLPYRFPFAD